MKTIKKTGLALLIIAIISISGCSKDEADVFIDSVEFKGLKHDVIEVIDEGLYPGKFDYHPIRNKFLIGSLSRSEAGFIHPVTGKYKTFIEDKNLASVTGVRVDTERNRIILASGDLGFATNSIGMGAVSYLGIYNLKNGKRIAGVDFSAFYPEGTPSFANDIAIADNGDIYITDSNNPIIFKVDNSYQASIFLNGGEAFANVPPIGLALNGIVIVDDFLIVGKSDDGALFKIPLDNPTSFKQIDAPLFLGCDGLLLKPDGDILMVETGLLGAHAGTRTLTSSDNWESASTKSLFDIPADEFPTSATFGADGEIYVITSHLLKALSGNLTQDSFKIYKVL